MVADSHDTICAIATPAGRGGVGIVRVSGPAASRIADRVLGKKPPPRMARYGAFRDAGGEVIDEGIALFFPGPGSFTGEDVLELQAHGGPVLLDMLLRLCVSLGARIAEPGEISRRAFLNGKLDLAQTEAVADLIDSATEQAVRAAARSLSGVFSKRVREMLDGLIGLRSYVEAAIDFPEEEVDFLADDRLANDLDDLLGCVDSLLDGAQQGRLLRDGLTLVLAGRPNAGKSSLLNALAGYDAAIVTPVPGTTRDLVREQLSLDGMPLHIVDTAGLTESPDIVEAEGVRRARAQMREADRVLLVLDDTKPGNITALLNELPGDIPVTTVRNKIDLSGAEPGFEHDGWGDTVRLSATTGAGLDALREHLRAVAGFHDTGEGTFLARTRHLDALKRAREHLVSGKTQLRETRSGELLAEDLRQAQNALGEITGEFTSDDLLGSIFSSFCIGK
ncbi:MAG: tRNA uridine-5-carboxymethylaminomethyl(34) synthesis GTPase MnmE [Gammaproteobacteria bacterium]|nr:MAG: tRNA uridine-5-carboxymethylaminomethyl(34) synthesis GTPase MnmE [Gammaproteobacteria bacterium]